MRVPPILETQRSTSQNAPSNVGRVFVPATIGNVGPGFDVLGLCVDGLGDIVEVELTRGPPEVRTVTGRDADAVPRDPSKNCASIAARAMLDAMSIADNAILSIHRALPISGGLGSSAAASLGGAIAAAVAANVHADVGTILEAALLGEAAVAGRHLDNIAPCLFGGVTIARSVDPCDVVRVPLPRAFWVAVVTPDVRVETREARRVLPDASPRAEWIRQMAQVASLVVAFSTGDTDLLRRAIEDPFAEPRRKALIPRFDEVKRAALRAQALGCSISGAGSSVFALCEDEVSALRARQDMIDAFSTISATGHVGRVAETGARVLGDEASSFEAARHRSPW